MPQARDADEYFEKIAGQARADGFDVTAADVRESYARLVELGVLDHNYEPLMPVADGANVLRRAYVHERLTNRKRKR